MVAEITRSQVLSFRVRAQQLDRTSGTIADTAVLDLGVQDTGPDAGRWALTNRGVDVAGRQQASATSPRWMLSRRRCGPL